VSFELWLRKTSWVKSASLIVTGETIREFHASWQAAQGVLSCLVAPYPTRWPKPASMTLVLLCIITVTYSLGRRNSPLLSGTVDFHAAARAGPTPGNEFP
jgi:hypothetical protein